MAETPPTLRGDLNDEGPDKLLILLTAFLLPGAGHAMIGLMKRGVSFFVVIALMFTTGLLLGGRLYDIDPQNLLTILATLASHGSGIFDLAARFAGWAGDPHSRTYEYGTVFLLTSGLMNLMLVFDVWERLSTASDADPGMDEETPS